MTFRTLDPDFRQDDGRYWESVASPEMGWTEAGAAAPVATAIRPGFGATVAPKAGRIAVATGAAAPASVQPISGEATLSK